MTITLFSRIHYFAIRIVLALMAVVLVLYLLIWMLSPLLIRGLLNSQLAEQDLRLSDNSRLVYNPFVSRLSVHDLALSQQGVVVLSVDQAQVELDLHELLFSRIYVKTFQLVGLFVDIDLSGESIHIAGLDIASFDPLQGREDQADNQEKNSAPPRSGRAYELVLPKAALRQSSIVLRDQYSEHRLEIANYSVGDLIVNASSQRFALDLDVALGDARLALNSRVKRDQGVAEVITKLRADKLDMGLLAPYLPSAYTASGLLAVDTEFTLRFDDNRLSLSAPSLDISGEDLKLADPNAEIAASTLNIATRDIAVDISKQSLQAASLSADIRLGKGRLASRADNVALASWQSFTLDDFILGHASPNASSNGQPLPLQAADSSDAPGFDIDALSVNIAKAELLGLQSGAQNQPLLLDLTKIQADTVFLSKNSLNIEQIAVGRLNSTLVLDEQKKLANGLSLNRSLTPKAEKDVEKSPAEKTLEVSAKTQEKDSFHLKVQDIALIEPSQISLQDNSVSPTFNHTLYIDALSLKQLDSQSAEPSPFSIQGRNNDDFARYNLVGELQAFSEHFDVSVRGNINEISLPSISPYVEEVLGLGLKSGQLDTDLNLSIAESVIEGKAQLALRGLKLSSANNLQSDSLKNTTFIPVNVALGTLLDKKGNAKMSVPLRGRIDDPSFGVDGFIALVVKKAVMKAARSYVIKTFVPYSNVVSVSMNVGQQILKLRFKDLVYSPEQLALSDQQTDYIDNFITLMKDRPKTQVKICAFATLADIGVNKVQESIAAEQAQALRTIAEQRAQLFKKTVVERGEIASSRLLPCSAQVDLGKKARPRIEISI